MSNLRLIVLTSFMVAGASLSLCSQSATKTTPTIPTPQIHPGVGAANKAVHTATAQPHQPSCWQLAGISKATMDERNRIGQASKAQIEAVCANPSLSSQQRSQEIRQISQQRQRELEGTITPLQAQELKSCNQERAAARPPVVASGGPRRGPCGEILPPINPIASPKPQPGTNSSSGTTSPD